jgi:5-hydroxyisourate hydrolase-like protein (transthyretin family)
VNKTEKLKHEDYSSTKPGTFLCEIVYNKSADSTTNTTIPIMLLFSGLDTTTSRYTWAIMNREDLADQHPRFLISLSPSAEASDKFPTLSVSKRQKYSVTFESEPAGATVTVDNFPVGKTHELLPGTYTARFTLQGYQSVEKTFTVKENETSPRTVKAELRKVTRDKKDSNKGQTGTGDKEEKKETEVVKNPGEAKTGSVTFTVTDDAGQPVSGVNITITKADGSPISKYSKATRLVTSGQVTFDKLPHGTYQWKFEDNDDYEASKSPFTLNSATQTVPITLQRRTGSITFTVKDDAGQPVSGVNITITKADGSPISKYSKATRLVTSGQVTFDKLPHGTYQWKFEDNESYKDSKATFAIPPATQTVLIILQRKDQKNAKPYSLYQEVYQ